MTKQSERRQEREAGLREALDVAAQHVRRGRLEEAMELYRRVFQIDPNNFEAAVGVGDALLAGGRIGDAIMAYGGALKARPEGSAGLFVNRGAALVEANDLEAASASFRRALALEPDNVLALTNLGSTCAQMGAVEEALELFERVKLLNPDRATGYFNAALALAAQDPVSNAEAITQAYRQAIEKDPKFAPAYVNLAQCLLAEGRNAEALELVEEAELQAPKDLPVLFTKGQVYEAMGEFGNAVAVYDRAVLMYPEDADARLALARACLAAGKLKKAMAACFELLTKRPELPPAKLLLGHALLEEGKITRGREMLEEVEELPGAQILLRQLAWADGTADVWAEVARQALAAPGEEGLGEWDGAATDAPVLIDAQGVDPEDLVEIARLLPRAASRCGRLVLRRDRIVGPLLDRMPGIAAVVSDVEPLPTDLKLRLPFKALPKAMGLRGRDLPAEIPYLQPLPERGRDWDAASFVANEPVVAVCWRERGRAVGPDQDLTFRDMEPLFEDMPARFLSFTYRNGRNDTGLMEDFGIADIASQCRDLEDVLAALSLVDLVITTDGLIPHLAGALGKECWLLLPVFPEWRWGRRGMTCPAYPSIRIFRGERTGDWGSVMGDVRAELTERMA